MEERPLGMLLERRERLSEPKLAELRQEVRRQLLGGLKVVMSSYPGLMHMAVTIAEKQAHGRYSKDGNPNTDMLKFLLRLVPDMVGILQEEDEAENPVKQLVEDLKKIAGQVNIVQNQYVGREAGRKVGSDGGAPAFEVPGRVE